MWFGHGFDGDLGRGVAVEGVVTITQTISFCPHTKYLFSAWVGYWDDFDPAIFNTTITGYLDDRVIVPTQLTCADFSDCSQPPANTGFGLKIGYRRITAYVLTPKKTSGVLKLVFQLHSTAPDNPALQSTVLDDITLTRL
jgi:hypothetical protein